MKFSQKPLIPMGSTILISNIWYGHQRNGCTLDRPQAQSNMAITTCFLLLDKKLNSPSDAAVKMQSWKKAPNKHLFMDKRKTKYAHQQFKFNSRDARLPAQTTAYPTKPFECCFLKSYYVNYSFRLKGKWVSSLGYIFGLGKGRVHCFLFQINVGISVGFFFSVRKSKETSR